MLSTENQRINPQFHLFLKKFLLNDSVHLSRFDRLVKNSVVLYSYLSMLCAMVSMTNLFLVDQERTMPLMV